MDKGRSRKAVEKYPIVLIKRTARELVGEFGPTYLDREDLEQEILLELWAKLPKFDPNLVAHQAYVRELVGHKAVSIVRDRTAEKRDYRLCTRSLNERCQCEDVPEGQELQDVLTEEHVGERLGLFRSSDEDLANLRVDVAAMLAQLPPDLRWLCECLMNQSVSEIVADGEIARATLYRRLQRLRSEFESKGFGTTM